MRTGFIIRLLIACVYTACVCSASAFAADDTFAQGVTAFNSGQYALAARAFETCKANRSTSADLYYYSALTYEHLGKFDAAAKDYLTVVQNFGQSEAAGLALEALRRPSFSQILVNESGSAYRAPGLDYYPKETWVPFKRVRFSVVVEAQIDGRAIPMIFDTGASSCTFTMQQLRNLGISVPTGPATGFAGGVGSARRIPAWNMLIDLKLGKIERKKFPIIVIDSQIPMPLLGENFYHDFEYSIDANSATISFRSKDASPKEQANIVKGGVTVGADGRYVYNVPFTMEGKSIIVTAKIDGRPCQMIFDTGADLSMFTRVQVSSLGVRMESTGRAVPMAGVSGRTVTPLMLVKDVQLGPISGSMICAVTDQAAMRRPLLGQNFFRDYPYTIDHANGVIKFQKK
jgi:predicted aspartyl protease